MTAPVPPRAPHCPADRTVYGHPCDGPGTYYCDDSCERVARTDAYVIDRHGRVWLLIRSGGMAARVAVERYSETVQTAGIAWLEREAGPLLPLDPIAYRRSYPRAEVTS